MQPCDDGVRVDFARFQRVVDRDFVPHHVSALCEARVAADCVVRCGACVEHDACADLADDRAGDVVAGDVHVELGLVGLVHPHEVGEADVEAHHPVLALLLRAAVCLRAWVCRACAQRALVHSPGCGAPHALHLSQRGGRPAYHSDCRCCRVVDGALVEDGDHPLAARPQAQDRLPYKVEGPDFSEPVVREARVPRLRP